MHRERQIRRVAIFADESADWMIAGLRQIDRIIFALEELAKQSANRWAPSIDLTWDAQLKTSSRHLPNRNYATSLRIRQVERADLKGAENDFVSLTTHLLVTRTGLGDLLPQLRGSADPVTANAELARLCAEKNHRNAPACCKVVANASEIPQVERWLMKSLGKPQDGWIARNFNRRISRQISRFLLRLRAKPVHATVLGFLFALAGCAMLVRGDYASILTGTLVLYGYSILDGCDGEIARAKYLDSAAGQRLDLAVDTLSNMLFVISLALGLAHGADSNFVRTLFNIEGLTTALLIAATEAMLIVHVRRDSRISSRMKSKFDDRHANDRTEASSRRISDASKFYDRHAQMLGQFGAAVLGNKAVHLIAQSTKRDVSWFAFIVLAAVGLPEWILHLSCLAAFVTASVSAIALIRRPASVAR